MAVEDHKKNDEAAIQGLLFLVLKGETSERVIVPIPFSAGLPAILDALR